MAAPGYTVNNAGNLVGSSVTKSLVAIISGANTTPLITELACGFDATSSSGGKARVQLCTSTQAGAGTPGSSPTPLQIRGKAQASASTAAINYSAEPTVLVVAKEWPVDITTGIVLQFPLGREPEQDASSGTIKAYVLRVIMPATVALAYAYLEFEEQ